ncbi:hypothetical protein [Candidatus Palauibacter sp.]|uniref:hypothetical protein n=1 Tax=Candidatus Palauibacter sp. TaxID=3101350 RepID=UPI003AF27E8C
MDALRAIDEGVIGDDLRAVLRSRAWLPAASGSPVKPDDVIDLQASLRDEAHRLVAEHRSAHGPVFAVPEDLHDDIQKHQAWRRLQGAFSSGTDGIERLGLLLTDLSDYHIGEWPEHPEPDQLALLARCRRLPGWRLLATAADGPFCLETVWDKLGSALSRRIDVERLVSVLNWISEGDDRRPLRKSIHDIYLRQLPNHGLTAAQLSRLRLASADGRWQPASRLCHGYHGVVSTSALDASQGRILKAVICSGSSGTGRPDHSGAPSAPAFWEARPQARDKLRCYFQPWEHLVPKPMIGVVLGLLGRALRDLAEQYLHPHSFEWFVQKLPRSSRTKLELISVGFELQTQDKVAVSNLLGEPMSVALEPESATLLVGAVAPHGVDGYMVTMRFIDPGSLQPERSAELLRATAERLSRELLTAHADFGSLWRELDQTDQLEIGIARRLILDHVPFYLRQLSVRSEQVEQQLLICDSCRRRIAEAEAGGQSAELAREDLHGALEELAERIDGSPHEQQAVLQAVKNKLQQYQYDPSSIPFELFQNADDAVIELGELRAIESKNCNVPESARRFVVEERADGLGFLHWGRPVNARGPVDFDGERRGYDRDLEKMLILSASDKPGDERVTGKFGLGFKSVLLACDQPRLLSDRLAVRVVAGILPQPWDDAQETRRRLTELGTDSELPGTLIDLPEVGAELRDRVLERFRDLAGIQCAFGRAVRSIECVGASEASWGWQPRSIFPGVEVGELDLQGDGGDRTTALCVRTDSGTLLMALGPQGFRPLPDTVPALWVTAPTHESSAVGFAVNGSFDLDAGRGRLAGDTANNVKKAGRIGREVGDALSPLLDHSHEDWGSVRSDLRLAANLDAVDFWESVWIGLTKGCLGRVRDSAAELLRRVALAAVARLCERPGAIPNGLGEPLRGFADANQIRYELSGVLLCEDVGATLSAWPRFASHYPGRSCVSKKIADILRQASLRSLQTLDLSTLLGVLERCRTEPDDADVLGRVLFLTEEASDWLSDDLRERLGKLLFRSEAGGWVEARRLLALHGTGLDPDEARRHAVAPPQHRLHADYYVGAEEGRCPAVAFFLACRRRMDAPVEKIAEWVLNAGSVGARARALEYLADGDHGDRVAECVRGKDWLQSALSVPKLTEGLTEEQIQRLRRRLVPVDWISTYCPPEPVEPIHSRGDLPKVMNRLYRWWSGNPNQRHEYRARRLYPEIPWRLHFGPDDTGRIDRPSWFLLLALGSFQGMGRTREEQHRSFVQRCQRRGWWDIFASSDPQERSEEWMNIIDEYAEEQDDDEEWAQWMAQFPRLYRISRWLDDYADLFLSLDSFEGSFDLQTVLSPRSDSELQGGGIDPPPLTRTLRLGSHVVVRELLYHGVLRNPLAVPHAYAPIARIRDFFEKFGVEVQKAEDIHRYLRKHLGEDGAKFGRDYDIPLRFITSSRGEELRDQLLQGEP